MRFLTRGKTFKTPERHRTSFLHRMHKMKTRSSCRIAFAHTGMGATQKRNAALQFLYFPLNILLVPQAVFNEIRLAVTELERGRSLFG